MKYPFLSVVVLLMLTVSVAGQTEELKGPAPDFTLKSFRGENLRLSEFRGEVVMINFWASWCAVCKDEMPILNDLHLRYQDHGLAMLGVNIEEDKKAVQKALRELKVVYPVLFDTDQAVSKLFDIEDMPSTVLVDRDGNLRYLHRNYSPGFEEDYERQVRELMQE